MDPQTKIDTGVEEDIKNKIKADLQDPESKKDPEVDENKDENKDDDEGDVKNRKKKVEKDKNSDDNNKGDDEPDEQQMFNAVVQKVLDQEFDGDESRLDEARAIANTAVKTFDGDPIKAAKSYRNFYRKQQQQINLIKQNPFIEKLIKEAQQGKTVDENYAKEVLGTATSSAEQPTNNDTSDEHEQLDPDDFDPDDITVDTLKEAGFLDEERYQAADAVDRKDMVDKARIRYAYKVLPEKMSDKVVQLSQKKQQQKQKEKQKDQAIKTNKKRIREGTKKVVSKYDVDFEGNPDHARLWEEIKEKAFKVPDFDDDTNMLIAEDAVERATRHVFQKHGVQLNTVGQTIEDDNPDRSDTNNSEHKQHRMQGGSMDAMERILSDTKGFQGKASKNNKDRGKQDDEPGNTLSEQVNKKVQENLNRGYRTSKMISNNRKMDGKQ